MPPLPESPESFLGSCGLALLAVFAPPAAVLLRRGCTAQLLVSFALLLLLWIPAVVHALIVCFPSSEQPPLEPDELDLKDVAHARRLERHRRPAAASPAGRPRNLAPSAIDPPVSLYPPPDADPPAAPTPAYFVPADILTAQAPASSSAGAASGAEPSVAPPEPWRSNFPHSKDRPAAAAAVAPPTTAPDWRSNFPQSKDQSVPTTSSATTRRCGAAAVRTGAATTKQADQTIIQHQQSPPTHVAHDPRSSTPYSCQSGKSGAEQAHREPPPPARYLSPPPLPASTPGRAGSSARDISEHLDPVPPASTSASPSDVSRTSRASRTSRTTAEGGYQHVPASQVGRFRVLNPSSPDLAGKPLDSGSIEPESGAAPHAGHASRPLALHRVDGRPLYQD